MTFALHEGDVLDVLQTLPAESFDGLLSDPPAGISFMGKAWDGDKGGRDQWIAWLAGVMREALRVLRPGAHVLVWALPRTSHWTATAIEDAGFEVRDVICHLFGSGFPKSSNVSKMIDAANGDERAMVNVGTANCPFIQSGRLCEGHDNDVLQPTIHAPTTRAGSAESERWAGQGTALKPAMEAWILARKPLDGTIAHNAATHGTGGINVDGCRVAHAGAGDLAAHVKGVEAIRAKGGTMDGSWKNSSDLSGASEVNAAGRWPANLVLTHSIDCVSGAHYGDADGRETVDAWQCIEGCPVRELDEQSGDRPGMSGGGVHAPDYAGGMFGAIDCASTARGDSGGASRFFPQFQWSAEDVDAARFMYTAKASRFERDFGCDDLPLRTAAELTGREPGSAGLQNPRAGAAPSSGARNSHPTIKAVGLTKWLATLLLPPARADGAPRRILVPFLGSGSEAVGALRAGWDHVEGVERDPDFVAIAKARLERWAEVPAHVEPTESKPPKADARQVSLFAGRP